MKEIIDQFQFKGTYVSHQPWGCGHINTTYAVDFEENGGANRYILQKINHHIFTDVAGLMENIANVTNYLREKIVEEGGNPDRETLTVVPTKEGKPYYASPQGDYYRAYIFIRDAVAFETASEPGVFGKSGEAFGKFQKLLKDFPADTLHETIPNFHNTWSRYQNFLKAVEEDKSGRKGNVAAEISFVKAREADAKKLVDLIAAGRLPLRVTHNDTKLNNVMLDEATKEGVCVIDLDTVMPGLALYDFGDSIRFGANHAVEDEKDLDKVYIDLALFEEYAAGFLGAAGGSFTKEETELLAFSAKLMTFECGMRFLTDYLEGDTYFKTKYADHNLVRCRDQFKLVESMEEHMDEMNAIVEKYA